MWADITQLWSAIDTGNRAWGLPAYNGGLFSCDPAVSAAGAAIEAMAPITDAELAPALAAMLIDRGAEGEGPVDFRSLSVRTFGTIYEGLLESQLSLAEQDLAVRDIKGLSTFVPAAPGDEVEVAAGSVYFHNRSGVRKSTGSYFTKPFAVEHLLDHALEPALDDHLARLDELAAAGDAAGVEAAFFDFRCADIAMGSGHFLVAAVDRIERRLSGWLSTNAADAAGVLANLGRLRESAVRALGTLGGDAEIETGSLLRRQVARSCIYGVDLNRVAVDLARPGGRVGIVLPRTAVSDDGMAKWRLRVTQTEGQPDLSLSLSQQRIAVLTCINHKGWVFDEVHNSYTVALVTVTRPSRSRPVSTPGSGPSTGWTGATRSPSSQSAGTTPAPSPGGGLEADPEEPHVAIYPGPASSREHYDEVLRAGPELVPVSEFRCWSVSAAFPQVPSRDAFRVWRKMKRHPRFDGSDLAGDNPLSERERSPRAWRFRPVQGDLNATNDRHRFFRDDGRGASEQSRSFTRPTTGPGS